MAAPPRGEGEIHLNASTAIDRTSLERQRDYAQLLELYISWVTTNGYARVIDQGEHTCSVSCTVLHVPGAYIKRRDGKKMYVIQGNIAHGKVLRKLDDLFVCDTSMKTHICAPAECTHSERQSDAVVCTLTGRILDGDPVLIRGDGHNTSPKIKRVGV